MTENAEPHRNRISIVCPKCTKELAFDAAQAGTIQKCLKCGESIQLPKKDPSPPSTEGAALDLPI